MLPSYSRIPSNKKNTLVHTTRINLENMPHKRSQTQVPRSIHQRYIYLFESKRKREKYKELKRERDLLSSYSFSTWPKQPALGQSKARSQKILPDR